MKCLPLPSVKSVNCSLVVTCWERTDLLATILCVIFSFAAVTFPNGVLGQVSCLIVSFPDLYLLSYFSRNLVLISYLSYFLICFRCNDENTSLQNW